MRHIFILILTFSCSSLSASDFREFSFGDSCSGIAESEISSGSIQINPDILHFIGVFYYKGDFIGENLKILYKCNEQNNFIFGFVLKKNESQEEALLYIQHILNIISTFHGEPKVTDITEDWKEVGMNNFMFWELENKTIQIRTDNFESNWDVVLAFMPKQTR